MANIYDIFRGVQSKKDTCYDETSAAFVIEGNVSNEVTHVRLNQQKQVALIFNDKEGPDDAFIFSKKQKNTLNNFKKGDYFIYDGTYFLIYEDVKLSNKELPFIKQRAVECNVIFNVNSTNYYGAFFSTMRKMLENDLVKSSVLVADERPIIVVPKNSAFVTGISFMIENKPWIVNDYDNITNKGITYLYLEKYIVKNQTVLPIQPLMALGAAEALDETPTLIALVENTLETYGAFFAAVPKVEILERKKNSVKFSVPFGIDEVLISTKNDSGQIIETYYKVVEK